MIQLLRDGPGVGVYAVCLDADERLLPAECQAVVVAEPDGLRVQQAMTDGIRHVRPDAAQPGWCLPLARSIAPDQGRQRQRRGVRRCPTRPGCWTCSAGTARPRR